MCSSIAQSVEQVAVNHWVGGSSPSRGAISFLPHENLVCGPSAIDA